MQDHDLKNTGEHFLHTLKSKNRREGGGAAHSTMDGSLALHSGPWIQLTEFP